MATTIADQLLEAIFGARATGAQIIALHGEIGRGKTFTIQQFYDALCAEQPPNGPWQPGLVPTDVARSTKQLLHDRKRVRGIRASPLKRNTPWYWIAATCGPVDREFDAAAAEISEQMDEFVRDLGYEASLEASKVLADGAVSLAADLLQVTTVKTIVDTVIGMGRVLTNVYESRPSAQERNLHAQRSKLVQDALRRMQVDTSRDGAGTPLVVVLDDAHLAGHDVLSLLSTILMPGKAAAAGNDYFPHGVAVRQNPIIVVVCSWPHARSAVAYANGPFNTWMAAARRAGVPITDLELPNGFTPDEALEVTAHDLPLADADLETVVGAATSGVVNPLVLKLRIAAVASYLDNSTSVTSLENLDTSRLPTSPLDPVRDLYEALPASEKRLVARLAAFGRVAPWRLLVDQPTLQPESALPQAMSVGLISRFGPDDNPIEAVGFVDDLSVAYFDGDAATLFPTDETDVRAVLQRVRPWLQNLALDPAIPITALSAIGGNLASALRRHGGNPALPALAVGIFYKAIPQGQTPKRRLFVRNFSSQSASWAPDVLAGEILAIAGMPRLLGDLGWSQVFGAPALRRFLRKHPQSLAARAIALSRNTVPCAEMQPVLTSAVAVDGEIALWRLIEVAALFPDYDLDAELDRFGRQHPELRATAAVAKAVSHGPEDVIALLKDRTSLSQVEIMSLSEAYANTQQFEFAATTLAPLYDLEEFAMKAARLFARSGDSSSALAVLNPYLAESVSSAFVASEIDPDVEASLAYLQRFLDVNVQARMKSSQILSREQRYPEALTMLLPLEGTRNSGATQAIASLRTRKSSSSRSELTALAEEAWLTGDFTSAPKVLEPGLDDPAIAAVWAEYSWALGERTSVIQLLHKNRAEAPSLSITLGELANEAHAQSREEAWLADPNPNDVDYWMSELRQRFRVDGKRAAASSNGRDGIPPTAHYIVNALKHAGEDWHSDLKLSFALEQAGHPDWAAEVLAPWADTALGEGHRARLMVDYGQLVAAEDAIFASDNSSVTMAAARAAWHLAAGDPMRAADALSDWPKPQAEAVRVIAILASVDEDPRAALEAARLLSALHQEKLAIAVLALAAKTTDDPTVRRELQKIRYRTPELQRRAYGRLRRRHAIRTAFDDIE